MAEDGDSADDRTEAGTARHLEQARESGNVPVSREVVTLAGTAAVVIVLYFNGSAAFQQLSRTMALFLSHIDQTAMVGPPALRLVASAFAAIAVPALLAGALAAAAAVLVQTQFLLHLGAMSPKVSRVNPWAGGKRLFGVSGVAELVKSLAKMALVLIALWLAARGDVLPILAQPWQDPRHLPMALATPVLHLLVAGLCTQALVAAADLVWVHLRHARSMRMSKQAVREENKDANGNPQIKARIRRIRMLRARRRMMAAVPKATVVVTNPTHYAVALSYDPEKSAAPRLVAKGVDDVAARIREVARANNVPMVANPLLARALYQRELDTDIPAEHYKAVAEIIAYVWRLRLPAGRRPRR